MLPATKFRPAITGGLLLSFFLFGAAASHAQSVGDAARRERERKKEEPRRATRVYTDDDLKKPHILDREDRARFLSARENQSAAATEAAAEVPVPAAPAALQRPPAGAPLGDVARYYRLRKQLRERAEISRTTTTAPPGAEQTAEVSSTALPRALHSPPAGAPLGDVARYYRLRKQLRERAEKRGVVAASGAKPLPPMVSQASRRSPPTALPERSRGERPSRISPAKKTELRRLVSTASTARASGPIVRVRRGDSLWKLAEQHLGSGVRWHQIAAVNPQIRDPHWIQIGDRIRLPSAGARSTAQIQVAPGDTLWSVAESRLGDGMAWVCIARANPQLQDVDLIYPGQLLALPPACAEAP